MIYCGFRVGDQCQFWIDTLYLEYQLRMEDLGCLLLKEQKKAALSSGLTV